MVFNTFGGDKRDRTADLLNAIQALSQLSYTPILLSASGRLLYYSILAKNVNTFFQFFKKYQHPAFRNTVLLFSKKAHQSDIGFCRNVFS